LFPEFSFVCFHYFPSLEEYTEKLFSFAFAEHFHLKLSTENFRQQKTGPDINISCRFSYYYDDARVKRSKST